MIHLCTYFDSRYLIRGLALYHSLCQHLDTFVLHVLCMDDQTFDALTQLNKVNIQPIALSAFEAADPRLLEAKSNRSLVEYYFTCTAALPLYVLNHVADVDMVTYLDADLYFFGDPKAIYDELGDQSVLIIEHRYPSHLEHKKQFGIYNVGMQIFRNDQRGRACLTWWHEQCLHWCYDRLESGNRFADQKYLDDWPQRFAGVVVLQHKGGNVAPWNVSGNEITLHNGRVMIDNDPLIFYHFHGLKVISSHLFDPALEHYGVRATNVLTKRVYGPYLRQLRELMRHGSYDTTNLRGTVPMDRRDVIRKLLYGRTLLSIGPLATPMHLEPIARPLLKLRQFAKRRLARAIASKSSF